MLAAGSQNDFRYFAKYTFLALRGLDMKFTAIAGPKLQLISWPQSMTRFFGFVSLMKPRIMLLSVFTALVGLMIAPGYLDPLQASVAMLAIAERCWRRRCPQHVVRAPTLTP